MTYIVQKLHGTRKGGWPWEIEIWVRQTDRSLLPDAVERWAEGWLWAPTREYNRWAEKLSDGSRLHLGSLTNGRVHGSSLVTKIEVPDMLDPYLIVNFVSVKEVTYEAS